MSISMERFASQGEFLTYDRNRAAASRQPVFQLQCRSCEIAAPGRKSSAHLNGATTPHKISQQGERTIFQFDNPVTIASGGVLTLELNL